MRHSRPLREGSVIPRPSAALRLFSSVLAVLAILAASVLFAQDQPKSKDSPAAKAEAGKPDAPAKTSADAKPQVGDGEKLSFDQSKVAAEMNDLEERMFRLAEAIKKLEPENSSKLMLALKKAREELILHQMKETQELLQKLELGGALTEEKQLLAKLQRLHDLLMSMDLDFQMRLERLRLIREILRRLDGAIKEEDREEKQSLDSADAEKQAAKLREQQVTLEALIKRQTGHVDDGKKLAKVE